MGFDDAFNRTLAFEGGYSNDPNDPGGATKFGITELVARSNGYKGDMKDLTLDIARSIYKKQYWDALFLSSLKDSDVAGELFDSAVNCGVSTVKKWCFTTAAVISDNQIDRYEQAINAINLTDKNVVLKILNILQGKTYIDICISRPSSKKFLKGWLKRVTI